VLLVKRDGAVAVLETGPERVTNACAGRRPAGLVAARRSRTRSPVGAYFAEMARMEAASVEAFRILGRELMAHRAPERLRRAARRAAADEILHARIARLLARRFGARPAAVRVEAPAVRSLFEIALENAVEGCVHETYAALEASWQATAATDPIVREAMKVIAPDETRHGALAWRVAAWIEPRLSRADRTRVRLARASAAEGLRKRLAREPLPDLVRVAGLPAQERATALVSSLRGSLWAA